MPIISSISQLIGQQDDKTAETLAKRDNLTLVERGGGRQKGHPGTVASRRAAERFAAGAEEEIQPPEIASKAAGKDS